MTQELVPASDSWVGVVGDVWRLADAIARTEFVPVRLRGKGEAVAACILTGRELGLGPMTSLRGIDVIEGAPSLSTELLAARMFAAGHRVDWKVVTDKTVTVAIRRGDGLSEAEVTWTLADAERAGLSRKPNWQKYPRAMLRARALAECAQLVCPDVSLGLEALTQPVAEPRSPVQLATVELVQQTPAETRESSAESSEDSEDEQSHDVEDVELVSDAESFETGEASPPEPEAEQHNPAAQYVESGLADLATFTSPVDAPPPISAGQIRALNAILRDMEKAAGVRYSKEERRIRIHWGADLHDDPRTSMTELTHAEAGNAIQRLSNQLAMMRQHRGEAPEVDPNQQTLA